MSTRLWEGVSGARTLYLLVMKNQQLPVCSTTGLVIGNMKECSFKGHIGSSNSPEVFVSTCSLSAREVYHGNCGDTALKNTKYSYRAKWNLALEKIF